MSHIISLSLKNFRSYQDSRFDLGPEVTVIIGPNASGKTNLLEAVYVLAITKSFRAKDSELINKGNDYYRLEAELTDRKIALGYQESSSGRTKKIAHDGIAIPAVKHVGTLQSVLFEPNDTLLIYGSPDRRRRYIDGILSQSKPGYLKSLHSYRRVLQHRNKLLSDGASTRDLFAWDMKLSEYAAEIYTARRELFEYLNSSLASKYKDISSEDVEVHLDYLSSLPYSELTMCYEQLRSSHDRDLAAGFTTQGPHRDDFRIIFKHGEIGTVASRGEIRSLILAMKSMELQLFEEVYKTKPILLLDDVFSELDEYRRSYLINMVKDYQTIITTTNADSIMENLAGKQTVIYTRDLHA